MTEIFTEKERDLFYAITLGNHSEVTRLLEEGANPSIEDPTSGLLPIHLAARYGNTEILFQLLNDERVRADSVDRRGKVPYEWADEFKHEEAETLLINHITTNPKRYDKNAKKLAKHHIKVKEPNMS